MSEAATAGEIVVVLTTVPEPEAAARLLRELVQARLIACGSVVPGLTSIYRWQDEVVAESETMLVMKTPRELVAPLFERIGQLHPYELPELVALPVEAVSTAYCRWVRRETIEVNA
ncbi:MAG TPA: divalent-cation tolerance protein CutA [Longimicrobiaceae bacterium]|nr:divalent-cation tolerance protein CutA [Longimicrobiaceae bacterium]